MKRLTLLLAMAIICLTVSAQDEGKKSDTIRIGGMIIVKKGWISKKNRKAHMEKEQLQDEEYEALSRFSLHALHGLVHAHRAFASS